MRLLLYSTTLTLEKIRSVLPTAMIPTQLIIRFSSWLFILAQLQCCKSSNKTICLLAISWTDSGIPWEMFLHTTCSVVYSNFTNQSSLLYVSAPWEKHKLTEIRNDRFEGDIRLIFPSMHSHESGEGYYVHRIFLYCRDFHLRSSLIPKRSVVDVVCCHWVSNSIEDGAFLSFAQ